MKAVQTGKVASEDEYVRHFLVRAQVQAIILKATEETLWGLRWQYTVHEQQDIEGFRVAFIQAQENYFRQLPTQLDKELNTLKDAALRHEDWETIANAVNQKLWKSFIEDEDIQWFCKQNSIKVKKSSPVEPLVWRDLNLPPEDPDLARQEASKALGRRLGTLYEGTDNLKLREAIAVALAARLKRGWNYERALENCLYLPEALRADLWRRHWQENPPVSVEVSIAARSQIASLVSGDSNQKALAASLLFLKRFGATDRGLWLALSISPHVLEMKAGAYADIDIPTLAGEVLENGFQATEKRLNTSLTPENREALARTSSRISEEDIATRLSKKKKGTKGRERLETQFKTILSSKGKFRLHLKDCRVESLKDMIFLVDHHYHPADEGFKEIVADLDQARRYLTGAVYGGQDQKVVDRWPATAANADQLAELVRKTGVEGTALQQFVKEYYVEVIEILRQRFRYIYTPYYVKERWTNENWLKAFMESGDPKIVAVVAPIYEEVQKNKPKFVALADKDDQELREFIYSGYERYAEIREGMTMTGRNPDAARHLLWYLFCFRSAIDCWPFGFPPPDLKLRALRLVEQDFVEFVRNVQSIIAEAENNPGTVDPIILDQLKNRVQDEIQTTERTLRQAIESLRTSPPARGRRAPRMRSRPVQPFLESAAYKAFCEEIKALIAAQEGKSEEEKIQAASRRLAKEALELQGEAQVRKLATAFVLGFGKAGLEFLLADLGKSIVAGDMKALNHTLSHMDDLAQTHAWLYFGGGVTSGTIDAVMAACPQLTQGFSKSALNHFIKPWLGLVIGSALNEYAKTGRINWGAQAKTAIEFKIAGLAVWPLRQVLTEAGLVSGPVGIFTTAAFLAIEMTLVHQFEKTLADRDRSKLVVEKAHLFDTSKDDKKAVELSLAIAQYAMGEGLYTDFLALDEAYVKGGKVVIENGGQPNNQTLLGRYLKKMGVDRDGYQSVSFNFGREKRERTSAEAQFTLRQYLYALRTIQNALKKRFDSGEISELRYQIEMWEAKKREALTLYDINFWEKADVLTETAQNVAREYEKGQTALHALLTRQEEALLRKLFGIHENWLQTYAGRKRLIQWDHVHLANVGNYKQAVDQSLPAEPERVYLVGQYLIRQTLHQPEKIPTSNDSALMAGLY